MFDLGRALTTYEDPTPAGSAYVTGQMTFDADGKTLTSMDRRQAAAAPSYALGWTAFGYDGLGRQTSGDRRRELEPQCVVRDDDDVRRPRPGDRHRDRHDGSQRTEQTLDLGGRATETDDGFTCATATYGYRDLVLFDWRAESTSPKHDPGIVLHFVRT